MRLAQLPWLFRYYLGKPTDDWYLKLFDHPEDLIAGDITPAYSLLDIDDIIDVRRVCPDARILYLLRDPVDRAWSTIRHNVRHGWSNLDLDNGPQLLHYLRTELDPWHYQHVIRKWLQVFGPDRVWLGFFDHVVAAPGGFLTSLAQFLGIDPSGFGDLPKPVNAAGGDASPPIQFLRYLASAHKAPVDALAAEHGEPFSAWATRYESILEGSSLE